MQIDYVIKCKMTTKRCKRHTKRLQNDYKEMKMATK